MINKIYISGKSVIRLTGFILVLFFLWGCTDHTNNETEEDTQATAQTTGSVTTDDDASAMNEETPVNIVAITNEQGITTTSGSGATGVGIFSGSASDQLTNTGLIQATTTIESFNDMQIWYEVNCDENLADNDLINAFNRFAFSLFSPLKDRNSISAPGSILHLIHLTTEGAESATADQINDAFPIAENSILPYVFRLLLIEAPHESSIQSSECLTFGSALWGHDGYRFSEAYLNHCAMFFDSEISSLPFSTLASGYKSYINDWLSDATSDNFSNVSLTSDTPELTRLTQASVVALKENQTLTYDEIEMFEGLFERLDGRQFYVPMVRLQGTYNMYEDETIRAVELPVEESSLVLNIFIPKEGAFESNTNDFYTRMVQIQGEVKEQETEIVLPEFSISTDFSVKDFMEDQGVYDGFNKDSADFSGINNKGYLYLKDFTGKALIRFKDGVLYAADMAALSYEATEDEPEDVWDSGYIISGVYFTYTSFIVTLPTCEEVYIKAGTPDAIPFIFTITDRETRAIFYIGQLIDAGGRSAGSWECITR